MTPEEKQVFANEAEKAWQHPFVEDVIEELTFNLRAEGNSLVAYGIRKVCHAVAMVARAQALGIDPQVLRMNDDEIAEHMQRLMETAAEAGKLIVVVTPDGDGA